jgi:hypothetical protein
VPFFEEVPSVARLGPKHGWRLKSWAGFGSNAVLAISAPWLDREHPDKHGATLRRMLPVLQGLLNTARAFASHEHATIGVFWDVCCIPRIIPPAPSPDKWRAEPPPPPAPAEPPSPPLPPRRPSHTPHRCLPGGRAALASACRRMPTPRGV